MKRGIPFMALVLGLVMLWSPALPVQARARAGTAPLPRCSARDLAMSVALQGAMGHREGAAFFQNTSSHACTLTGRPQVRLVDAGGRVLGVVQHPGVSVMYPSRGISPGDRRLGIVRPGRRAYSAIRWGNFCGRQPKLPIILFAVLPGGGGTLQAHLKSVGAPNPGWVGAPPCLGPSLPSDVYVGPIALLSPGQSPLT